MGKQAECLDCSLEIGNPSQQGLKPPSDPPVAGRWWLEIGNPSQQGLKLNFYVVGIKFKTDLK